MSLTRRHILTSALGAGAAGGLASLNLFDADQALAAPVAGGRVNRPVAMLAPPKASTRLPLSAFRSFETAHSVPFGHIPGEGTRLGPMTAPAGSQFDAQGVLKTKAPDGKWYMHPVVICHYILSQLDGYHQDHVAQRITLARRQADALAAAFVREDSAAFMPYDFDWSYYGEALTTPWYSGMAQGLGVHVMTWLASVTGVSTYMDHADALFNGFLNPFTSNDIPWVAGVDNNSMLWLDEYPRKGGKLSMVFNGHCFATLGLLRYWEANRDGMTGFAPRPQLAAQVKSIMEGALSTAQFYKDLCRVPGNASSYVVNRVMPHPHYHATHIALLQLMYDVTLDSSYVATMDHMITDYRFSSGPGSVSIQPGTWTLYKLDTNGHPTQTKTWKCLKPTSAPADARVEIDPGTAPRFPGFHLSAGFLSGWVIGEVPNKVFYGGINTDTISWLTPRRVELRASVVQSGRTYNAAGTATAKKTVTLTLPGSFTSDRRANIGGVQQIHLLDGPLAGMWVPEGPNAFYV